jgi:hypothetical protein
LLKVALVVAVMGEQTQEHQQPQQTEPPTQVVVEVAQMRQTVLTAAPVS